jgi:hypothetical protein
MPTTRSIFSSPPVEPAPLAARGSQSHAGLGARLTLRYWNGHLGWVELSDRAGAGYASPHRSSLGRALLGARPGDVISLDAHRAIEVLEVLPRTSSNEVAL